MMKKKIVEFKVKYLIEYEKRGNLPEAITDIRQKLREGWESGGGDYSYSIKSIGNRKRK